MSKIFKPRRGKASTMNGTKSSTVLAAGEMFIELPDTGVGTGICKMKMGDGVTAYSSLPYAMGGDIASTEITGSIVEDTSATATAALANVTTGRTLGAIIGSLRRACQLNASAIATLNDDLDSLPTQLINFNMSTQITQYNSLKEIVNKLIRAKTKIAVFYATGAQLIDGPTSTGYIFYIIFSIHGDAIVLAINRNTGKLYHTMIDYQYESFSYNWVEC